MLTIIFLTAVLLYIIGFYYLIVITNLICKLIALELLTKGITLVLIYVGKTTGQMATAQSMVITLIIIEVVILAVAAGIIINIFNHTGSLNAKKMKND
jgi:multisubunit Na+/H+ antiporter MnhC subunit